MPAEMRNYISQQFGDGGFMVRREIIHLRSGPSD